MPVPVLKLVPAITERPKADIYNEAYSRKKQLRCILKANPFTKTYNFTNNCSVSSGVCGVSTRFEDQYQ